MIEHTVASRTVILVLALITISLAFSSFSYFFSELHSFQGKRYERFWESRGAISSVDQWERAQRHMKTALNYNDQNPSTWLRSARILEWYLFSPSPNGDTIRVNLEEAALAIDRALDLRPNDGSALSARAQLKSRRWQIDESLSGDMVASYYLAPWERSVLRRLIYTGVVAWPALDSRGQELLLSMFASIAEHRPIWATEMLLIASDYGRLNDLCDRLSGLDFKDKGNVRDNRCPRAD